MSSVKTNSGDKNDYRKGAKAGTGGKGILLPACAQGRSQGMVPEVDVSVVTSRYSTAFSNSEAGDFLKLVESALDQVIPSS